MTRERYRAVDSSGASSWYSSDDEVRAAFRDGAIDIDGVFYGMSADRWYLVRGHPLFDGLTQVSKPTRPPVEPIAGAQLDEARVAPAARQRGDTQVADAALSARRRFIKAALACLAIIAVALAFKFNLSAIDPARSAPAEAEAPAATQPPIPPPAVPSTTAETTRGVFAGEVTYFGKISAPTSPISAKLRIDLSGPSDAPAEVTIGAPLRGTGSAAIAQWRDSMVLVSTNIHGDTILWFAARTGQRYEGSYLVLGGESTNEGGRWWVESTEEAMIALRKRPGRPVGGIIGKVRRAIAPFQRLRADPPEPSPSVRIEDNQRPSASTPKSRSHAEIQRILSASPTAPDARNSAPMAAPTSVASDYVSRGQASENGEGVLQSWKRAVEYYQLACDLDEPRGCVGLANLFAAGHGVVQDYQRAAQLDESACALGYAVGCSNARMLYKAGLAKDQPRRPL